MSPLKIGFIVSFVLHSLLIAMFVTMGTTKQISKENNYTIAINLSNLTNTNQTGTQTIKQHKKERKEKKKQAKEIVKKEIPLDNKIAENKDFKDIPKEEVKTTESNAESSTESDIESNDFNDYQDADVGGGGIQMLDKNSELFAIIKNIIDKNNQYPKMAHRRGIEGSIIAEFILFKNGEISEIKILNEAHNILNQGAINAIKRSYKEFPSMKNNVKIKVTISYNLI